MKLLFIYFFILYNCFIHDKIDSGYSYTINKLCYNPLYYQVTNVYKCVYQHIT